MNQVERSLLLFEPAAPCWDEETFSLAGEDPSDCARLERSGLLTPSGSGYVLTDKGEQARRETCDELYVAYEALPDFVPSTALWDNRLRLLMDRTFVGQFGVKEYSVNESLEVVPMLTGRELFDVCQNKVRYTWSEHPIVKSFLDAFPKWGVATRNETPPGREGLDNWAKENGASYGAATFDLILRSRYDFELYRKQPSYPSDRFKMKDADRLFFNRVAPGEEEKYYETLGRLHLFLLGQKRIYIPGYADIDSHDQENWTMSVVVADDESSLEKITKTLSMSGKSLIDPIPPLFIIGTSIERLRNQTKPDDTVYDWFCDKTVHIVRADS